MYSYAIYEIYKLIGSLKLPMTVNDPVIRYLCGLFSELAYFHVPANEFDNKKRAKIIPCRAYQEIIGSGIPTDLSISLQQLEFQRYFVVVERGAIAVGIVVNNILFIAFRGTHYLYDDWKTNLTCAPVSVKPYIRYHLENGNALGIPSQYFIDGRFHSGFYEEAMRISIRVMDKINQNLNELGQFEQVFLTGHSLGGAIAAISEFYLRGISNNTSGCIFGAPRYCDIQAYSSLLLIPPIRIRRIGDIVPTTPPKKSGYADHPYDFTIGGEPYPESVKMPSTASLLGEWIGFFSNKFEPHSIEEYRYDLGHVAGASAADLPLAPFEKLTVAHI